jgi:hypothetical protein
MSQIALCVSCSKLFSTESLTSFTSQRRDKEVDFQPDLVQTVRNGCPFCSRLQALIQQETNTSGNSTRVQKAELKQDHSGWSSEDGVGTLYALVIYYTTARPADSGRNNTIGVTVTSLDPRDIKEIFFELYSSQGSYADRQLHIHRRPPATDRNLESLTSLLLDWINECLYEHSDCQSAEDAAAACRLPRRLIDVGSIDDSHVRLVEMDEVYGSYVALSHCWGPKGTMMMRTLKENLEDFKGGIEVSR